MDLDELCVAILCATYGVSYLYEFGGLYEDIFFRNMWFVLIPTHMLAFALLAVTTSYYERILKDHEYAREHFGFIPIVLAIICHAVGWIFLARINPSRRVVLAAQLLLMLAQCLIQTGVRLRKPFRWIPALCISVASLLVYIQRELTAAHWAALYTWFITRGKVSLENSMYMKQLVLPSFILMTDIGLALIVLGGLVEVETPTRMRTNRKSIKQSSVPWWSFIEMMDRYSSPASWWTGLQTINCDHGYQDARMSAEEAQHIALKEGLTRCACCKLDTNLFFSEYLMLSAFITSVLLAAILAISDLELIVTTPCIKYTKMVTYAFLWVPHFLYSCPVRHTEQRKRNVFAYWLAVASTGILHHLAINHSLRWFPRWISVFTDYIVIGLLPETISDSIAYIGLRGSAHKKAMCAVLSSALILILTILSYKAYLPNLQLTTTLMSVLGFFYPAAVILDKIDYVRGRGRTKYLRHNSSVITADWWKKRPGRPATESSGSMRYQ